MAADIDLATIGVGFDTTGLEKGQRELDKTATAANKAADAATRVGEAAKGANADTGAAMQGMERTIANLRKQLADINAQMDAMRGAAAGAGAETERSTGIAGTAVQRLIQRVTGLRVSHSAAAGAAQLLGSSIVGLGAVVGVAATATGFLAYAMHQADKQAREFEKTVLMTGGAAGVTTAQLVGMADSMATFGTTHAKAAEALNTLAATGQIAGDSLQRYGDIAIQAEKAVGQSIGDTAKHFDQLGGDPVRASLKLNDSMNYLTASTYAQIKAAMDLGDQTTAAQLAQDAYADALDTRSRQIVQNLGWVEKSWNAVKNAAKWAWDAMLGIGRSSTAEEKIASLDRMIKALEDNSGPRAFGMPVKDRTAEIAALQAQRAALMAATQATSDNAKAIADRNDQEKAGIKWMQDGEKYLKGEAKLNQELSRIVSEGVKAGKELPEILERMAKAREAADKKGGSGVDKDAKAYAAAVAAAEKYIASLKEQESEAGATATQIAMMRAAVEASKAPTEALANSIMQQALATALAKEKAVDAAEMTKRLAKADLDAAEARNKFVDSLLSGLEKMEKDVAAQQEANAAIGLSKSELAALTAAKLNDQAATLDGLAIKALDRNGDEIAYNLYKRQAEELRKLAQLKTQGSISEAAVEAAKEATREWEKFTDSLYNGLTDSLYRAFDAGKNFFSTFWKGITNTLKTSVLKVAIQGTLGATFGGSGLAQAATSGVGSLGSASSMASALFGSSGMFPAVGAAMGEFGTAAVATTQSLIGLTGTAAQAQMAATMGAAAQTGSMGFATTLGTVAPYLAAAMAIYMIAKSLDHSGTPHIGGGSQFSAAGGLQTTADAVFSGGFTGVQRSQSTIDMTSGVTRSIVGILDSTATSFGKAAGYQAATSFADDSSKDGAWGSLVISKLGNVLVDWADTQTSKWAPKVFADGEAGSQQYLTAISADVRRALDGIGLPAWATNMLNALGDSPSLDQLAATVQQINVTQMALETMRKTLVGFAGLTDGAIASLISASGGIEQLAQNAGTYYENFYSDDEKKANTLKQIGRALGEVGLAAPATREEFRKLVEQQQSLGDSGAPAVAALLGVAGAFASVIPAAEDAANAVGGASASLANAIEALRNPVRSVQDVARGIFNLEMDGANLQVELLRTYGDSNSMIAAAALQRSIETAGMTAQELALYDLNVARRGEIDSINAARQATADGVASWLAYFDLFGTDGEKQARAKARVQAVLPADIDTVGEYREYVWRLTETFGTGSAEVKRATDIANDFALAFPAVEEVISTAITAVTDLSAYQANFYTESERTVIAQQALLTTFNALGLAMPDTNAGFRALVDAQDLTTESGITTFNTLMNIQGAFAGLHPLVTTVTEVIETLDSAIASLRASGASRTVQQIAQNMLTLEEQLFQMQNAGNTPALRQRVLAGLSDVQDSATGLSERDLQQLVWSLEDTRSAAETAAQALANAASEHDGLWRQWLQANGDTAALRELELAALDPGNRDLQLRIWALEDEKAAAEAAAQTARTLADEQRALAEAAAQAAKAIADQHDSLWRQWLTTTGDIAALRALDLAALDPSNRALQEQIWAYEDQKAAAEEATRAADSLKSAWESLTDSLLDEVRRIRGVIDEASGNSYASLQAQFAITTAQARAGDQSAAGLLPGLSQSLLTAAESSVATLVDLQRARALTANSLEQTAGLLGGGTASTNAAPGAYGYADGAAPGVYSPTPPASTYGLADMVGELRAEIAALKDEVRGLRGEQKATGETIAINTGKTARLNQKWDDVGLPITTETDLAAVYGA